MAAMLITAFTGDAGMCGSNRLTNEILFTAQGDSGSTFSAILPAVTQVRLLEPAARLLPVTEIVRDGEVFHARLARYDDEPAVRAGVYLASVSTIVSIPFGETFLGAALATVRINEDLPAIPRPVEPEPVEASATESVND